MDAGIGCCLLICQNGWWAREAVGDMQAPVGSMIVAVIEIIDTGAPADSIARRDAISHFRLIDYRLSQITGH